MRSEYDQNALYMHGLAKEEIKMCYLSNVKHLSEQ